MSEEHKREQAYCARAGGAAGYGTTTEFRTSMVNNLDPRLVAAAFGRTAEAYSPTSPTASTPHVRS